MDDKLVHTQVKHSYVSNKFAEQNNLNCRLNAIITRETIAVALCSLDCKALYLLKSYAFSSALDNHELVTLVRNIAKVDKQLHNAIIESAKISLLSEKHLLVPSENYSSGLGNELLQLQFDIDTTDYLHRDVIESVLCENIYAFPVGFSTAAEISYPEAIVQHSHTVLLSALVEFVNKGNLERKAAFINVTKGYLDVFLFDKKNLIYANHFEWQVGGDVFYYALYSLSNLGFNVELDPLYLTGAEMAREGSNEHYVRLKRQVKNLVFMQVPYFEKEQKEFSNFWGNQYFDLLYMAK